MTDSTSQATESTNQATSSMNHATESTNQATSSMNHATESTNRATSSTGQATDNTDRAMINTTRTMISFEEAQRTILERAVKGTATADLPIAEATGYVLAERIESGIDMPPFDKSAMDGFAFRHDEHTSVNAFRIVATIAAGDRPGAQIGRGECARIMTGAPVPAEADTVIPVEDTSLLDSREGIPDSGDPVAGGNGERVRFHSIPSKGAHIALHGEDIRAGNTALDKGHLIQHLEVAVLAAVGRRTVKVYAGPSIAFAATGEELVEPGSELGPGQIYNSNASALRSQILAAKATPHSLGVVQDKADDLRHKIAEGLRYDMLLLSGGVSMGKYDLVPDVLRKLGVEIIFHKLLVKPAKPTLFGVKGKTMVFGLPGNPVSTVYAFDQYVAPAIRVFRRHPKPQAIHYCGKLTEAVNKKTGRLLLLPCVCEWVDGQCMLTPLANHGSADIFSIAGANAIGIIPSEMKGVEKGTVVNFRKLYEY
ncbi:MAG: molybdopterin molybdotransferase MoeA [Candidatus Eisenbacteria sp.]|nr:molybdopterin molybdotransferase MoeA [Candidatus Eisenbacteria bacterium]